MNFSTFHRRQYRMCIVNTCVVILCAATLITNVSATSSPSQRSGFESSIPQNVKLSDANRTSASSNPFLVTAAGNTPVQTAANSFTFQPINSPPDVNAHEDTHSPAADWWAARATVALAVITFLLAIFTGALWWVTLQLSRDARKTGESQSARMQESISEATRSTAAMQSIATATKENALLMQGVMCKQMRAYLAFDTAVCVPQDDNTQWRFEVRFFIKNFGHTIANAVNVASVLQIMEYPLPDSFDLNLHVEEKKDAATITPGQAFYFRSFLGRMLSKQEILEIKKTNTRMMYLYGTIRYEDIFGDVHHTNFCKFCSWDVKDNFVTTNVLRHNDAN
ncbi:hypothetical protein [Metallibacterium scheffleri]